ncbi:MAG: biotin/lipoyl-containing protein [Eubacteriales bacterium]
MRKFKVTVNGNTYEVDVEEIVGGEAEAPAPKTFNNKSAINTEPSNKKASASEGDIKVTAPMPGKIVDIKVNNDQSVKKGEVLAVLEAMKMENEIVAPQDGRVVNIHGVKGQSVESGDVIISLD